MHYTLSNEDLSVVLDTQGGSLVSIKDAADNEYLWQPDSAVWTGQAPICFPICGGLRNGRATTLAGHSIKLPRHGFARKRAFCLADKGPCELSLVLESDAETLSQYPFPFRLTANYTIAGATLHVKYLVTNTGTEAMPFFIGGHPAFICPLEKGYAFTDYALTFEHPEEADVPTPVPETGLIDAAQRVPGPQAGTKLSLSHELFSVAETIYDKLESSRVTLSAPNSSRGVRLTFEDFPYLIVWSKPTGDFVAIEPWCGLSTCSDEDDVLEHKRGCLIAAPGKTIERGFAIDILS